MQRSDGVVLLGGERASKSRAGWPILEEPEPGALSFSFPGSCVCVMCAFVFEVYGHKRTGVCVHGVPGLDVGSHIPSSTIFAEQVSQSTPALTDAASLASCSGDLLSPLSEAGFRGGLPAPSLLWGMGI